MEQQTTSNPLSDHKPIRRSRLSLKDEFSLALLPSLTVLLVFALVKLFSHQRLLFTSLASSAFLIYLDPEHVANSTRTLLIAQLGASLIGYVTFILFNNSYIAGGAAMILAISLMIFFDAMHPPAVATSLVFAFKSTRDSNLLVFAFAVGLTALLIGIQRFSLWRILRIHTRRSS